MIIKLFSVAAFLQAEKGSLQTRCNSYTQSFPGSLRSWLCNAMHGSLKIGDNIQRKLFSRDVAEVFHVPWTDQIAGDIGKMITRPDKEKWNRIFASGFRMILDKGVRVSLGKSERTSTNLRFQQTTAEFFLRFLFYLALIDSNFGPTFRLHILFILIYRIRTKRWSAENISVI